MKTMTKMKMIQKMKMKKMKNVLMPRHECDTLGAFS